MLVPNGTSAGTTVLKVTDVGVSGCATVVPSGICGPLTLIPTATPAVEANGSTVGAVLLGLCGVS